MFLNGKGYLTGCGLHGNIHVSLLYSFFNSAMDSAQIIIASLKSVKKLKIYTKDLGALVDRISNGFSVSNVPKQACNLQYHIQVSLP